LLEDGTRNEKIYKEARLIINTPPIAMASDIANAMAGKAVHFDASKSYDPDGYIVNYLWEFGDGSSANGLTATHTYLTGGSRKAKLTVTDNNITSDTLEIMVTVEDDRADLKVTANIEGDQFSGIKFYKDNVEVARDELAEGDNVKVVATLYNEPNSSNNSAAVDSKFYVGFYVDYKYKGYKTYDASAEGMAIAMGGTGTIEFDWTVPAGNHIVTIIANDIGKMIEERNHDNNRLDIQVGAGQIYFPDLQAMTTGSGETLRGTFTVDCDGKVAYLGRVPMSIAVKNIGTAAAGPFSVSFFANDKLVASERVEAGLAVGAQTTVTSYFKPAAGGAYHFEAMIDGPGNYIIEADETNNRQTLDKTIQMAYPDLTLNAISITPASGHIIGDEPVTVTLNLVNHGSAISEGEIELTFYADRTYLGSVVVTDIGSGEILPLSFIWSKPMAGGKTIYARVNERKTIVESDLTNNEISADFASEISTLLPGLTITAITAADVAYGGDVNTTVSLLNSGTAATPVPFKVTLYANGVKKAEAAFTGTINPGQTADITLPIWQADLLPTGKYTLTTYADSEQKMRLSNRNSAIKTVTLRVNGGYQMKTDEIDAITGDGTAGISVSLLHTDQNWRPVEDARVTYAIYSGANLTAEPAEGAMASGILQFNQNLAKYAGQYTFSALMTGDYTVFVTARSANGAAILATDTQQLKCRDDFEITVNTLNNNDEAVVQYAAGEDIIISGNVSGITAEGSQVLIKIVGEEEWKVPVACDANGDYRYTFELPAGFGGSYSVKATANIEGYSKTSPSKIFTVEGVYFSLPSTIKVVQGRSTTLTGSLANVGTMEVSAISAGGSMNEPGITAQLEYSVAGGILPMGTNTAAYLTINAGAAVAPGTYTYTLNTSWTANLTGKSRIQTIAVEVVEARAGMDVIVLSNRETEGSPGKANIVTAVRPGDGVSQVVRITNNGNTTLTGFAATTREKLPWISLTTNGVTDILPLSDGLSIRDEGSKAIVSLYIAPNSHVQEGVYEDELILSADGLSEVRIPILINVGAENQGTVVFEVRNRKQTALTGMKVEMIGPKAEEGQQAASRVYTAETADGSAAEDLSESDRQGYLKGQVRFDNIPAGLYEINVTGQGVTAYKGTVDVPAAVNLKEQIVTVEEMTFVVSFNAEAVSNAEASSVAAGNYASALYKMENDTFANKETAIVANFPGDEAEFYYLAAQVRGGVAITNPSADTPIYGVKVEIDQSGSGLPDGTFLLNTPAGWVSSREMGTLHAGNINDINWVASTSNFYYPALLEAPDANGQFNVSFPAGVTVPQANINAWINEVDYFGQGYLSMVSYDPETSTGIFKTAVKNDSGAFIMPDNNVPIYTEETEFDFTIKVSGSAIIDNAPTALICEIPVRVRYLPGSSYLEDESGKISRLDTKYTGLFAGKVVKDSKSFSRSFISKFSSNTNAPEKLGDALSDFGFAQDVSIEKQSTKLNFRLLNPSDTDFMQDVKITLKVADGQPNADGTLGEGIRMITALAQPTVNIRQTGSAGNTSFDQATGILTVDELGPGEELLVDFIITPPESLESYYDDLMDTFTEYKELFGKNTLAANRIYSWLEYSFDTSTISKHGFRYLSVEDSSKSFSGLSSVRSQAVEPPCKVYLSYELSPADTNDYYTLKVVATNVGEGTAFGLTVSAPNIPSTGGVAKVLRSSAYKTGINWSGGDLPLGDLAPGETTYGEFTIFATGISDWTNLPGLAVKTSQAGNIVIAPLTLQKYSQKEFAAVIDEIIAEVDAMHGNIDGMIKKVNSGLTDSILSTDDYFTNVMAAEAVTYGMDAISQIASMITAIQKWQESYNKLYTGLTRMGNKFNKEDAEILASLTPEEFALLSTDARQVKESLDNVEKALQLTSDSQSKLDKLALWIGTVNWEEQFNDLGEYTEDAVNVLNYYAGAEDELADYEEKIKSSFENANKATAEAKLAAQASGDAKRKEHLALAETYRIKAAQDMKEALNLYSKLYKTAESNKDAAATASLAKMNAQGQSIAQKMNTMAAASVNHAQKVTTLGAGIMMSKYLLQGNSIDKILLKKGTDVTLEALLGLDSEQILSILDTVDKNGVFSMATLTTALDQFDKATFKLGEFADNLIAIGDGMQMKEIGSYAPLWVKEIGNLPRLANNLKSTETGMTPEALADLLRGTLHNRTDVGGNTEQFIADFQQELSNYTNDKDRIRFLVETAVSAMNVPIADSEEFYTRMKKLQEQGMSPLSAYNAAASGSIRYMEMNELSTNAQLILQETTNLLNSYKQAGNPDTAYYPASVLLSYVKSLNKQLEYTYANRDEQGNLVALPDSRLGRYRDIWIYKGVDDQLVPDQLKFAELYRSLNEFNSALADGYSDVADRWTLNMLKAQITASAVLGAAVSFGSGTAMAGAGLVLGLANALGDAVAGPWAKALDASDNSTAQLLARSSANVYINSGLAAAKGYEAAKSVNSVFAAVDQWKKIDPPIPVSVLAIDVTDITVGEEEEFGSGQAVITVRNDHTGNVTIAPRIQIMDSNGIIYNAAMDADTVAVGASRTFVADIHAPKATLRDPAGFDLYVSFELAEPSSMSIAGLHGPYVKHFMTGNAAQIAAMRANYDYTIPRSGYLGGEGNPAVETVTISAGEGTAEMRILLAALDGSNLAMDVSGEGVDIDSELGSYSELRSIVNDEDLLVIKNPSGDYTITIQGTDIEEYYTMQIGQLPDLGTVFDVVPPGTIIASAGAEGTQEKETEIHMYESSRNGAIDNVSFAVSGFYGPDGSSLETPALSTRIFGRTLEESTDFSIAAGDGKVFVPKFTLPSDLAAGAYTIGLNVTVSGSNLNANLDNILPFAEQGRPWIKN
jgi:hypothetical protein